MFGHISPMIKPIDRVIALQKENPNFLLAGSLALILSDTLPNRSVHDIDIVVNIKDFKNTDYFRNSSVYNYSDITSNEYDSYSYWDYRCEINLLNFLVFPDNIKLNKGLLKIEDNKIIIQDIDDILKWKQKYNREKDLKDLDNITAKALEDALFN